VWQQGWQIKKQRNRKFESNGDNYGKGNSENPRSGWRVKLTNKECTSEVNNNINILLLFWGVSV